MRTDWRWLGLAFIALGIVIYVLSGDPIPQRDRLAEARGPLGSLLKIAGKGDAPSSVRFTLATDPRHFHYHSSAGAIAEVWRALEQAGRAELAVLYDPSKTVSPALEDPPFHPAFEIRVGEKTIRSYAEVANALRSNDDLGVWLAFACLISGAAMVLLGMRRRR